MRYLSTIDLTCGHHSIVPSSYSADDCAPGHKWFCTPCARMVAVAGTPDTTTPPDPDGLGGASAGPLGGPVPYVTSSPRAGVEAVIAARRVAEDTYITAVIERDLAGMDDEETSA